MLWSRIACYYYNFFKTKFETIQLTTENIKFKCYRRKTNKQFLQVSGLCCVPFASYLQKLFTQIFITLSWRRHISALPRGTNMAAMMSEKPSGTQYTIMATNLGSGAYILSHKHRLLYLKCSKPFSFSKQNSFVAHSH